MSSSVSSRHQGPGQGHQAIRAEWGGAEPDILDYNLTIRRWIRAIMRIKTDILGRYFEEPGAGIKDLSRFIPRPARLNNV